MNIPVSKLAFFSITLLWMLNAAGQQSNSPISSAAFIHRDGRINFGFDPPLQGNPNANPPTPSDPENEPPWTIAVKGAATENVKCVITQDLVNLVELVVTENGENIIFSQNNATLTAASTDISITGAVENTTPGGLDDILEATIEVQLKTTHATKAKLKVKVVRQRTIDIEIFRIHDSVSTAPDGTAIPAAAPTNGAIIDDLNEIWEQAGIHFTLANANNDDGTRDIRYDWDNDGKANASEITGDIMQPLRTETSKPFQLFLIRRSGDDFLYQPPNPNNYTARGWNKQEDATLTSPAWGSGVVFVQTTIDAQGSSAIVLAHEIGHILNLTTRGSDSDPYHDPGPFPPGTDGLMKTGKLDANGNIPPEPGRWLPHEEWHEASNQAKNYE